MADAKSPSFLEQVILRGVREEIERVAEEEAAKAIEAINRRIGASIGSIVLQVSRNYRIERRGEDLHIIVQDRRDEGGRS
jgi:hypothetical protein